MSEESISIDDLDAALEEINQPEPAQRREARSHVAIRDMIVNPEIAKRLAKGVPLTIVAQELGVNPNTVAKWMRTAPMQSLIEVECRRILRHMSRRDLSKEKYLGIATAMKGMIESIQTLEGRQDEPQTINQTFIQSIDIALFGSRGRVGSSSSDNGVTDLAPGSVREIPEHSQPE